MRTVARPLTRSLFALKSARVLASFATAAALAMSGATLTGCAAEGELELLPSEELVGADETAGTESSDALTAYYPPGTRVITTSAVNLRFDRSTSSPVLMVVPGGSVLTLANPSGPSNGFYYVNYGAYRGFISGRYLALAPANSGGTRDSNPGGTSGSSSDTRGTSIESAFARARAGVGFSYWWGHGRWRAEGPTSSTVGVCRGSCPSCSHTGSYGADCSGYVAKIWGVPGSNADIATDAHPYNTESFYSTTGSGQWSRVSRDSARRGDALVFREGSSGHIVLFESGDSWGDSWVYEARGCAAGVVRNLRVVEEEFVAVRRAGW